MNVLARRLSAHPSYLQALEWGRLISITGSAQVLVQAVGLAGGILIIRVLSSQQYALYTLANTMLGTMTVLADGGISAGVMAQGGRVWQDREQLGVVLATGLALRKRFAVGSLLLATPVLVFLLRRHGATWPMAGLIAVALIPSFFAALSGGLLSVAPMLRQDIVPLQKNQISTSLGRLAVLLSMLFAFPFAFLAILAAGLPQIWANYRLRRLAAGYADWDQAPSPLVRQEILGFVRRILPGVIYYCLAGQITIWLISIFGSTTSVAQIGALGRLVMLLGLVNMLLTTLVLPRFARLPADASLLRTRYLQVQAGLLTVSGFIVGTVWLFPAQVLWLLGHTYAGLKTEVVLSVINGCLGLIAGTSFAICTSRGWAINPAVQIPVTIGATTAGVILFTISTLKGILWLNMLVFVVEIILYFTYTILKINQMRRRVLVA